MVEADGRGSFGGKVKNRELQGRVVFSDDWLRKSSAKQCRELCTAQRLQKPAVGGGVRELTTAPPHSLNQRVSILPGRSRNPAMSTTTTNLQPSLTTKAAPQSSMASNPVQNWDPSNRFAPNKEPAIVSLTKAPALPDSTSSHPTVIAGYTEGMLSWHSLC